MTQYSCVGLENQNITKVKTGICKAKNKIKDRLKVTTCTNLTSTLELGVCEMSEHSLPNILHPPVVKVKIG